MNGNNAATTQLGEKLLAAMGYDLNRSSLPWYENGGNIECGDDVVSVVSGNLPPKTKTAGLTSVWAGGSMKSTIPT
ncbi:MAG: hypothetical protein AAFY48_21915 [Bacteroidota bacterium]